MPKHVPLRQCLGCRQMKPKKELLRVVKSPEGEISIDFSGKKPGRGAYVCHDLECFKKLRKAKALSRAFSAEVSPEVYDSLEKELERDG